MIINYLLAQQNSIFFTSTDFNKPFVKMEKKEHANGVDPIVFFTGITAQALQTKLTNTESPHWYCFKNWVEFFFIKFLIELVSFLG
jgi:hypothetical protein